MTNELIHDVEESLKQERLEKLWKEYGPYIIAGVILAILFTASSSSYQAWNNSVNTKETALIISAMESTDITGDLAAAIPELRPEKQALAYMTQAGVLLAEDKKEEALAIFKNAAGNNKIPALYQDLAHLQAVQLEWSMTPEENPDTFFADLAPLLKDTTNRWHYHAQLQAALINAHSLENYEQAQKHLAIILNAENVAAPLKQRAQTLKQLYTVKKDQKDK